MASAEISSANGSLGRFQGGASMFGCYPTHGADPTRRRQLNELQLLRMAVLGDLDPQLGSLLGDTTTEIDVARKNRVFCNRNLRMDSIEMIGFDMDYTLALYHQDRLERLSID